jgi:hypothetical protein
MLPTSPRRARAKSRIAWGPLSPSPRSLDHGPVGRRSEPNGQSRPWRNRRCWDMRREPFSADIPFPPPQSVWEQAPPSPLRAGKDAFYVRPAVIDSQIFRRTGSLSRRCPTCSSLPRKAPVQTCPPEVDLFCLAVARKKADHVFLMVERGLCSSRDPESRSRSSTIFEARGPRLIKRWLPIASARRRTRVMTIFLRKCTTGGPHKLIVRSTS